MKILDYKDETILILTSSNMDNLENIKYKIIGERFSKVFIPIGKKDIDISILDPHCFTLGIRTGFIYYYNEQ